MPMYFTLATVFTFGLGGLTGLHLGAVSTNLLLHNTYFVVGHFHLTMAASSLLASVAGIYFWFPKMFGRMMDHKLGKIHFWMSFVPIVYIFCAMFVTGYAGMQRRIYNPYEYDYIKPLLRLNQYIGIAVMIAFAGQFIFVFNMIKSYFKGAVASQNPWEVGTLEWTHASSPPVHHNFDVIPTVIHGPHEYSHPKVKHKDWLGQAEPLES
jgi:cytochrome c oxidase subunit I